MADGPQRAIISLFIPISPTATLYHPINACGHEGSSHISPVLAL